MMITLLKSTIRMRPFSLKAGLFLTLGLALVSAGAVLAQTQLPGSRLTSDPGNDLRPVWSPDGSLIAYFTDHEGSHDIWVMDADGGNKKQLTEGPSDDRRPSWSPDGKWLTFDSDRMGTRDIWIMPAEGGDPIQVTEDPSNDNFPSWSPDGTRIAYFAYQGGQLNILVVDISGLLDGGSLPEPNQITSIVADENNGQCTFACHTPAWSPDSQQIAYTGSNHSEIFLIAADGGDEHEIHFEEAHMHFPTWTPDGRLLLLSEHNNEDNEPVNDVWIADADGSNASILYPNIPHGGPFYWNPGAADMIAFHSPRSGNFDIYLTSLTDTETVFAPSEEETVDDPVESEPPTVVAQVEPEPTSTEVEQVIETPQAVLEKPDLTPLRTAILWGAGIFFLSGISAIIYLLRKSK
jgi:Tol biopolymer transport system component